MLTSQSIATDPIFLEQLTGVSRQEHAALDSNEFVVMIHRDKIIGKLVDIDLNPDTNQIDDVQWIKKTKLQHLRDLFSTTAELPAVFVPVGSTAKDKLSGKRKEALLNARCTNWRSGCTTTVIITFGLGEVMAKKRVRVRFAFQHYQCHNHPFGVINGRVTDKRIRRKFHDKEPRVATIETYTGMDNYDPFNSVRRVPTHDAARKIRSKALRAGCLSEDLHESLRLKQLEEHDEKQFAHLPAQHRGHIHLLTAIPKFGVAMYCEKRTCVSLSF